MMGGNVYYSKRPILSVSATTAAPDYSAANALTESVSQPWMGTGAGAEEYVIRFPNAAPFAALLLQGVNFASCTVLKSANGVAFNAAGTFQSWPDPKIPGFRRGLIVIADASVMAIKLQIPASPLTMGAAPFIGALYPFAASWALPLPPDYGATVTARFPGVRSGLANGRTAIAITGNAFNDIELPFEREYGESLETLIRQAQAGTVGLALEIDNYPEMAWPVCHQQEELAEQHGFYNFSNLNLVLREVV